MKRESKAAADERRKAQIERDIALKKRNEGRASRLAAAMQLADYKKRKKGYG